MTPRSFAWLLAISAGLLAGLSAYTFQFAKGFAYFSSDPAACANCHIMQDHLGSWQKSPHHVRAGCNDCHTPPSLFPKLITKADNGWNHSVKFTLQNFGDPIRIRAVNLERVEANCLRCHAAFVSGVRGSGGHSRELSCVRCHSGIGHGPKR